MKSMQLRVDELLAASPDPQRDYYAFTLFLGENDVPEYACFSGWVGFTSETPEREIRQASLVVADNVLETWRLLREPGMVVESASDLIVFFRFGGHALIEESFAKQCVPQWLRPQVVVHAGPWGYASPDLLPATAMQRAPTAKLRMKILERDRYRCRVCGRSPANLVDIELHVHHIRPWALGGVTEAANLITLCHTCHNGLDPHFQFNLFSILAHEPPSNQAATYPEKLLSYQRAKIRAEVDEVAFLPNAH